MLKYVLMGEPVLTILSSFPAYYSGIARLAYYPLLSCAVLANAIVIAIYTTLFLIVILAKKARFIIEAVLTSSAFQAE